MRKIEIIEEELLIVKQALAELKEKLSSDNTKVVREDSAIIDGILRKIREELNK